MANDSKPTASKNVTAVQTPGAAAAPEDKASATASTPGDAGAESDAAKAERLAAENEELRRQIAASHKQTSTAGKADAAGRRDYLTMRAHEVNPATLTKSVLTKDGWVCPPALKQNKE